MLILYSKNDMQWKDTFVKQICVLKEGGYDIDEESWSEECITASRNWQRELLSVAQKAVTIVLFVSTSFLDSPFLKSQKIRGLLKSKQENDVPIYIVLINDCNWEKYSWMKDLPVFPKGGNFLSSLDFNFAESTLVELAEMIFKAFAVQPPVSEGILNYLVLKGIGPIRKLPIEPGRRLNIITGDNGVGKSFLLECIWWVFSGVWPKKPVYPRQDVHKDDVYMQFALMSRAGVPGELKTVSYDWKKQRWVRTGITGDESGLVIYARFDGSFAVWDPLSGKISRQPGSSRGPGPLILEKEDVLNGVFKKKSKKSDGRAVFNGLILDWIYWQKEKDTPGSPFNVFTQILDILSTPSQEKLRPGKPVRVPGDTRLIPSIDYPYGAAPITHDAASVQRILSLAYIILRTWEEHKVLCSQSKSSTYKSMIILIDELECHLHPHWQRTIFSSLLKVKDYLDVKLDVQFFVTTHSPLVMASLEPIFEKENDRVLLLDMDIDDREVKLKEQPFLRLGTVDNWFTSDFFGLSQPRSKEAEEIILKAMALQQEENPTKEEVEEVHQSLRKCLGDFDPFWPRWLYFAEQKGIKI
jgi:hypothetical protein